MLVGMAALSVGCAYQIELNMSKTHLITGCSGLIGRHLVARLAGEADLVGISRRSPQINVPIAHLPIDLSRDWRTACLPPRIDTIVHLAQSEYFREFPEKAEAIFQVNIAGTLRLIEYARQRGARRFILASTGGIRSREIRADRQGGLRGGNRLDFYLDTRVCSETLVGNYTAFMHVIILRFYFVYGPGQACGMLIPRLIDNVKNGRPLVLHDADGIRINPTHVDDAVAAIHAAMRLNQSDVIDIGGPEILSLRQIGRVIGDRLDCNPRFEIQPNPDQGDLIADTRQMASLLAAPRIGFREGLTRLLDP